MFDYSNTSMLASNGKIENPAIDSSTNRIVEDQQGGGGIDYDYDKTGSLTLDAENKRFVYDAEHRLKEYFRGTNSSSTPDAIYEYDGNGKRVRKVADNVETVFVYNVGGQLVAEYSSKISSDPKVSYLTADHLGSPRIVTDELGTVRSRHDYLAFGDEVTETVGLVAGRSVANKNGVDDDIRKQYTGYERDDESGLDYAQARYYSSQQGRFTSVDPLTASADVKNPQTFNRYAYVLNSPYKFTDPLGLLHENSTACGTGCRNDPKESLGQHYEIFTGRDLSGWSRQTQSSGANGNSSQDPNPTNPNAPVPGDGEVTTPNFQELNDIAKDTSNENSAVAQTALDLLKESDSEGGQTTYDTMTQYQQAVFLNTVSAMVDAGVDASGASFDGFYFPESKDTEASGIIVSGVSKSELKRAGLSKTSGDVVGLLLRGFMGRRSSGRVKTASLEATVKDGKVAFDVDLYNPKSGIIGFIRHLKEVRFNKGNDGKVSTHPADVARALDRRIGDGLVGTK